jgi:mevalonate kinase
MTSRHYPAKLILFGEYSLLLGSQVLGVPVAQHFGSWSNKKSISSSMKVEFFDYLKNVCKDFLQHDKIEQIQSGQLFYLSTIKRGYGIGSSGALSAAIYDYCKSDETQEISTLQRRLALIESFFHGESSGFDPLLSYLDNPIIRQKDGSYHLPKDISISHSDYHLYLLDSGTKRVVKGLVPLFSQLAAQDPLVYAQLVGINDQIIVELLTNEPIENSFEKLSSFQWNHMSPMILDALKGLWQEGLNSKRFFIKICGAGGGGYYMVYSKESLTQLGPYHLEPIILS